MRCSNDKTIIGAIYRLVLACYDCSSLKVLTFSIIIISFIIYLLTFQKLKPKSIYRRETKQQQTLVKKKTVGAVPALKIQKKGRSEQT